MLAANTETEFLERGRDIAPRDFVLCHDEMSSMAASVEAMWRSRGELAYVPAFVSFPHLPATVSEWVAEEMIKPDYPKSLVLVGPSRIGKTEWARSLGRHNYHGALFSLRHFDASVDYIVLDEFDIANFPQYKVWLGAEKTFYATEKYVPKQYIVWGKPCIWLNDKDPREARGVDVDWLNDHCVFATLDGPLFDDPPV